MEHNMLPEELALSLSAVCLAEGVGDRVTSNLSKARNKNSGGTERPLEPAVVNLLDRWRQEHRDLLRGLETNLALWIKMKEDLQKPSTLKRLLPFLVTPYRPGPKPMEQDVLEISWLIAEYFRIAAGVGSGRFEGVYGPIWEKAGITAPLIDLSSLVAYAYLNGRGVSEDQYLVGLNAATFAAVHSGSFITGLGNRMSTIAYEKGVLTLAEGYHQTIAEYVMRNYPEEGINNWQHLSDLLRTVINDSDLGRDFDRVGATEVRWAYNVGRVQFMVTQGTKKVSYVVQSTACPVCRKLYLNRDGTPKIFNLKDIVRDIAKYGGLNAYRKPEQVVPSALAHPWCACVPIDAEKAVPEMYRAHVGPGYTLDDNQQKEQRG